MRDSVEIQWPKVRDVGEVRMGKQLSPAARDLPGQFPYLRVANVHLGRIDYANVNTMGFTNAERETYGLKPGDILLNEGQSLELVGRSAIYDRAEGAFCFQNTLIRFRPSADVIPAYAQVVFERWLATGVFAAIAKQTTSIAHLGGDRFGALPFPLIPVAAQKRIVDVFDSVTALERAIAASVAKLRSVRQGLVSSLFSPAGAGQGAWAVRPLESVAEVGGGLALGGTAAGGSVELPYLRVANVQDGFVSTAEMKRVRVTPGDAKRYRLQAGDVLVTEGGDLDKVGRGAVWDGRIEPCLHQNHVFRVRCNDKLVIPDFLAAYMASQVGRAYFLSVAKQTTNLASISSSQLKAMPVPYPPLPEQERVVGALAVCDKQISRETSELGKLSKLKQGLMDDLLSGRAVDSAVAA
ncbi:restriction endonuclease subunit S [Streptomyces sp. NPDC053086]|uniref:restriction endonuclease subunit S n=1 Tax=unclassified Streptomyces TaxID=2593676 RepID=UPI0037D49A76